MHAAEADVYVPARAALSLPACEGRVAGNKSEEGPAMVYPTSQFGRGNVVVHWQPVRMSPHASC